jgi:thioredoxin-related protein
VSRLTETWKLGRVLRLNLPFAEANKAFAGELGVEGTPTFVLFDASGQELRRWAGKAPAVEELP